MTVHKLPRPGECWEGVDIIDGQQHVTVAVVGESLEGPTVVYCVPPTGRIVLTPAPLFLAMFDRCLVAQHQAQGFAGLAYVGTKGRQS
ncbi:MAG TPA: hypothetical protein VF815_25225 [Myxococcaceae bacterium]|jgi:hypothetical protein